MFSALMEFLSNPQVQKALFAYWVYSAFVGSLPSPEVLSAYVKSGVAQLVYRCLFGFFHGLSGNLNRAAIALKVPGAPDTP